MASFKINIGDPNSKKCYKTEIKDQQASSLIGLNIGEKVEGNRIGLDGYELEITGGTDYCGFPMRRGILGERKKISIYKSTGFKGKRKGMKKRKTVCGHKINDKISAVNLKVIKTGSKSLSEMFVTSDKEAKPKEQKAEEKPKEEKKEVKPEEKKEVKTEEKKEAKQEEKKEDKK